MVGKNNTEVSINEVTDYPFGDEIGFEVSTKKPTQFEWKLRIPSWCMEGVVTLNGKVLQRAEGGLFVVIGRTWKNGDKLVLKLPYAGKDL